MPDVVAWNEQDPLASEIFIECKARGETFKDPKGIGFGLLIAAVCAWPRSPSLSFRSRWGAGHTSADPLLPQQELFRRKECTSM